MADRLTTEQLNSLSKDELVSMMMSMQDRVESLSSRLDYLTEQIAISNNRQFGRSGQAGTALESGFSDYSSFVKSFRKLYGISPAQYREQLRSAMNRSI